MVSEKKITDIFPASLGKDLSLRGKEVVERLGEDVVKEVTFNVLCGLNLRESTEKLTRRRISRISSSIIVALIKASAENNNIIKNLPIRASKELNGHIKREEKWLLQWLLGLTDKGFQNILRDKKSSLEKYADDYVSEISSLVDEITKEHGILEGNLTLNKKTTAKIDWRFIVQLMGIIGSQTLTVRGSEKSTYGKLFEKLILGTTLSMLGFKFIDPNKPPETQKNLFWLSERRERRESDATVLCEPGKAVRFDIGFIGRGNPEISLDKVSRFERELEYGQYKYYASTIVLVDRIGEKSRIERLAERINGTIIQMSMSYWPKQLAQVLKKQTGYKSEILKINEDELKKYMKNKIDKTDIKKFL